MGREITVADLDAQEAQFLAAYFELGGKPTDGAKAAKQAGYATTEKEARRAAAILLSSPKIVDAIKGEVKQRLSIAATAALQTMIELCQSGPPSVRLAASREILDRGVSPVMSKTAVKHDTEPSIIDLIHEAEKISEDELRRSEAEKLRRIRREAREIVDAEFSPAPLRIENVKGD